MTLSPKYVWDLSIQLQSCDIFDHIASWRDIHPHHSYQVSCQLGE